jgi:hypothetical protein
MAGGGGIGMRTVWISLRAMNYTDQAFRASMINVDKLKGKEKDRYKELIKQENQARLTTQAGMLYGAMAGMLVQRLGSLLSETQLGATYMTEFNQTIKDLKVSLADALFTSLKPFLDVIKGVMDFINGNPAFAKLIGATFLLGTVFLGLKAIMLILSGQIMKNTVDQAMLNFMQEMGIKTTTKATISFHGLSIAVSTLSRALNGVLIGFSIFTMIGSIVGSSAGKIIAVIAAIIASIIALKGILSGGLTITKDVGILAGSIAIGAGLAAGLMAVQDSQGYAVGTRMVNHTGPSILHKGEMVYNPSVNRPAGIQQDIMGTPNRGGGNSIVVNFQGDLYTKANMDNIDEYVGKRIYRAVKGAT